MCMRQSQTWCFSLVNSMRIAQKRSLDRVSLCTTVTRTMAVVTASVSRVRRTV